VADHPKFWARLQFICENAPEICAFWMKKEIIGMQTSLVKTLKRCSRGR